jgi:hypothetical protein
MKLFDDEGGEGCLVEMGAIVGVVGGASHLVAFVVQLLLLQVSFYLVFFCSLFGGHV